MNCILILSSPINVLVTFQLQFSRHPALTPGEPLALPTCSSSGHKNSINFRKKKRKKKRQSKKRGTYFCEKKKKSL
jgi:hypothetical protein